MKICLLKDLRYLDWHPLETIKTPEYPAVETPPKEQRSAGNEVRKTKGEELVVDRDLASEAAEPKTGTSWFILNKTGHRFNIPNEDFCVLED